MALESLAIEKAAVRLKQHDTVLLDALVQQMEATVDVFDRASFHKLDMMFHRRIWACAGNEYLSVVLERVTFSLSAFVLLERTPGDHVMKQVVQQHRDILSGLLTQDPAVARERYSSAMDSFMQLHRQAHGAG